MINSGFKISFHHFRIGINSYHNYFKIRFIISLNVIYLFYCKSYKPLNFNKSNAIYYIFISFLFHWAEVVCLSVIGSVIC